MIVDGRSDDGHAVFREALTASFLILLEQLRDDRVALLQGDVHRGRSVLQEHRKMSTIRESCSIGGLHL